MIFRTLVSYHYHRDTDLAAMVKACGGPVEVFADSGAFSAHTTGATIRLADYAAWLNTWRDTITTAASLDVIGDPAASRRNLSALEQRGCEVLPVFHVGTPWPELEQICRTYDYVALGGMVPFSRDPKSLMRWLIRCFRIADGRTRFHGFGQTRTRILKALPFYSVDSTNWCVKVRTGGIELWDPKKARLRVLEFSSPDIWANASLLRQHGADPAAMADKHFVIRAHRDKAAYDRERAMARGASAVAWSRLGAWLQSRHDVAPPHGWTSPGTCLFLAETRVPDIVSAGQAVCRIQARDGNRARS